MRPTVSQMKQIRALYKYVKSYFKNEWDFNDYPLETWRNTNSNEPDIKFGASFTNWILFTAHGPTKQSAINNLEANFKDYKRNNNELPRPGKKVPIQYAETERIDNLEDIAVDFFDKIIEINYYDCFISDMTSLFDFDLDTDEALVKIKKEYNIEPKGDLFLVDIFEEIKKNASA